MVDRKRNLTQESLSGLAWRFGAIAVSTVFQLGIGVVLARLLAPAEFGLFGLALIVTGFAALFTELGMGQALIQRKQIEPTHVRVAFTLSAMTGLLVGAIIYAGAPLAAGFINESRVADILRLLSMTFVLGSLGVVSRALVTRDLGFKRIFFMELATIIPSGTLTIVLAIHGLGVLSLVYSAILQAALSSVVSYVIMHHPIMPLLRRREANDLLGFGVGMSLERFFNYFALQGDFFVAGRILGPGPLGVYTRAYSLMNMPTTKVVQGIGGVVFPAASRLQDQPQSFARAYRFILSILGLLMVPAMAFLIIMAQEIILGVYGDQWTDAIVPLQVLGCFGVFRGLYSGTSDFVRAKGWVYSPLLCQIVYGLLVLAGAWFAARRFGINGIALAVGLAICVMWIMMSYLGNRATGTNFRRWLETLGPGLTLGTVVGASCIAVRLLLVSYHLPHLVVLGTCLAVGGLVTLIALRYLPQRWLGYVPVRIILKVIPMLPTTFQHHARTFAQRIGHGASD